MSRLSCVVTFENPSGMTETFPQSAGGGPVARLFQPPTAGAMVALTLSVTSALFGCSASAAGYGSVVFSAPAAAAAFTLQVELSDEQLRQLQLSREVLLSESADITDETRRNAASLLIDLGAPESRQVLEDALATRNSLTLRAVLGALAERPADPLLLDATVDALRTAPLELCELVASVLAAHGAEGLEGVSAVALDAGAPLEFRTQAIHALGSFRNREGLLTLMSLLEPERHEPREVIEATCSALQSLTGMRLDSDPQRWRNWWSEFRDKPFAEVLRITVRRLSDQMANLERQNARLSELYANSLREVYLLLPMEEQLDRLASDLAHEMPQVRRLALDRVDLLLRDQVRLPDSVKAQLAKQLSDPEAAHRRLAARLLDESNYDGLRELLAAALTTESDPATAQEFLRVLIKRPTASAAQPALRWLTDPVAGPNAATLLSQLASAGTLPEEVAEEARNITRSTVTPTNGGPNAAAIQTPPPHARLLTVLGKERDLVLLEAMLDTAAPELRQAIADGLAIIGRAAPLVARAQDPIIYPCALRATANGKGDVDTLRRVMALTPGEQHRDLWLAEVRSVAAKVPHDQIMTADDLLAGISTIDGRTRVQLLQRAVDLPAGELPATLRRSVIMRSCELLLLLNEPVRSLDLLDTLGTQQTDEEVQTLSLRAAVFAGLFDRAQEIDDDPRAWIALLTRLVEADNAQAVSLTSEIEERFHDGMDEPTRQAFEAVAAQVQSKIEPVQPEPEPEASVDASEIDESVTP
jgi:hypothetical protein